jgi:predicted DNA-binding transcriptional regulator YafY
MNRIERLTAILLLLHEQPRTSAEIARRFEVSRRTVLRDVQALCEMGVPVVAQEGAGGGYSLPPGYRPAPLPLTAPEAFLLLLALSAITRLSDAPFAPERASLQAKLWALLPQQHLPHVEQLLETVAVDVPARAAAPALEPLLAAAQAESWVRVTYQGAERRSIQHLLPRQISAQNGFWYCRAYAYEHGEERTYRVDRVLDIAPAGEPFQHLRAPAPLPYDHETHPLVLATLTARGVAAAESEPHIGQRIERRPDGSGRLAFRCPPAELPYFARFFAGLGADAHVSAPPELRERLLALGRALLAHYS